MVSLNVNSIIEYRRKFMLDEFISHNPAYIYFLQETKFGPFHTYSHSSFSVLSSPNRTGCGGSMILVHGSLKIRNLARIVGPIDATIVDVLVNGEWISMGSIYIHPGCTDLQPLAQLLIGRRHFVLGGDFNARHPSFGDVSANVLGGLFLGFIGAHGFNVFSPPSPSCFHSFNGSFIDKFVTDPSPPFTFSSVSNISSFSDHSAIGLFMHCPVMNPDVTNGFRLRQFGLANISRMNRFLEDGLSALRMPTQSGLLDGDLELISSRVGELLTEAVERFVPVRSVRTNGVLLSHSTLAIIRGFHSAQRRLHRNVRSGTWLPSVNAIRVEVQLLRQMMLNAVSRDLSIHYSNALADTVSTRHAHNTIRLRTAYRRRAKCPAVLYLDEAKTEPILGGMAIADGFLRRFATNHRLTTDIVSVMDDPVRECCASLASAPISIEFSPIISPEITDLLSLSDINESLPPSARGILTSAEEVAGIICRVPPKKSSGTDLMPYFLFKHFSPRVILFFTILFNHLLARSYFPRCWKHSLVTPVPKPAKDLSVVSNWRPISNLNCISKIFERILAARLLRFIDRIDPGIFPDQYGFLREHSTLHALGRLHSAICDGLNNGLFTTFVSLDIRAAFDTVWHEALVFKMVRLGFPTFLSKSILSFLTERSFSVRVGDSISEAAPMPAGTPQGSVCSPILYNIYLHDLPRDEFIETIQFADDTSLFAVSDDPDQVQLAMNLHLIRLHDFFRMWKLLLNERKTVLVVFMGFAREGVARLRRKFRNIAIFINGHLLRVELRVRFLGVIFNRNNRFVSHIDHVLAKARRAAFALRPVLRSQLIEPSIRTNVYKLYIRPIITYASAVWARPICLSSHQMERLRAFERGILRMTASVRRTRGSFIYANNADLHRISGCPRIDRFICDKAFDFYQRCAHSSHSKISRLIESTSRRIFPELASVWRLGLSRTLLVNDVLLLFHRPYSGEDGIVYRTGQ